MGVYDDGDWFKCSKKIIRDKNLSQSAKWLYTVLSCLNNHYAKNNGYFSRTNADLISDSGMSLGTLKKSKHELVANGYIKIWHDNLQGNKQTTFRVCYYQILK